MTIKRPIDPKTMLIGSVEIYVAKTWADALKQLGVYKEQDITSGSETVDDVYSNYITKKIKNGDIYNIAFSYHEQRPEIMEIIENGVIELTTTTGGNVSFAESFAPYEWGFANANLLEKQDVNGNLPSNVTVEIVRNGTTTPLVSGTDYTLDLQAVGSGYTSIQFMTGGVLNAGDEEIGRINITYDVVEGAEKIITHKASAIPEGFVALVVWKGTYNGGDMRIEVALENVQNTKALTNFRGDSDDDTAGYACAFSGKIKRHKFIGF